MMPRGRALSVEGRHGGGQIRGNDGRGDPCLHYFGSGSGLGVGSPLNDNMAKASMIGPTM